MTSPKPVRCAIYTRKSSEEGLEQGFNSLDAQYDACAAYVLSQASEGWTTLPTRYDDGGISGGTLERPALKRLLADVAAGKVDTIVVYKVDRLSRSLFDFAKLVELFEKAGTSFVSITQSFNTTSSMGRLTLNMLLSFAQFEREVTAERIRDKIAASKARGMWMGGVPPLGYEPDGRSLAIVEAHASFTRHIFTRYLALGTVRRLAEELERERRLAPVRRTATRSIGGIPLSRGQLYKMLQCRLYLGEIPHKDQVYPGLHPAIIDRDTWHKVQATLAANAQGSRDRTRAEQPSLLAGRIVDETGQAMISSHASKPASKSGGRVRYAYYISSGLQDGSARSGQRIPAREVDTLVVAELAQLFDDPLALIDRAELDVPVEALATYMASVESVGTRVRAKDRALIGTLIQQIHIGPTAIAIMCESAAVAQAIGATLRDHASQTLLLSVPARLTRSGLAMRLIQGGQAIAATPDRAMIKLLARARGYWLELRKGELNINELGEREKVSPAYITRLVRLAFLSPEMVDAVLTGRHPAALSATALMRADAIAPLWAEQAGMLHRA